MLPLQITPTPTALYFKDLDHAKIAEVKKIAKRDLQFEYSEKNGFYIAGNEKELYKILLYLTYDFDVELM